MFRGQVELNPKKVRAVFFDFDGVILDSVDIKTQAFAEVLKQYSPDDVHKLIAYHEAHGGVSRYEKFRYFFQTILKEKGDVQALVDSACISFKKQAFEAVIRCPFIPGALEFLQLHHKNFKFFVISGTPQDELREVIKIRNLDAYFVEACGSPVTKIQHVEYLKHKYQLSSEDVVFVGDSTTDFLAALHHKLVFISV